MYIDILTVTFAYISFRMKHIIFKLPNY